MTPRDRVGEEALVRQLEQRTILSSPDEDHVVAERLYGALAFVVAPGLLLLPVALALKPLQKPEDLAAPEQSLAVIMGTMSFWLAVFVRYHFTTHVFGSYPLVILPYSAARVIGLALLRVFRAAWIPAMVLAGSCGFLTMWNSTIFSWSTELLSRVLICWLGIHGLASVLLLIRERLFQGLTLIVGGSLLAFVILQCLGLVGLHKHAGIVDAALWYWTCWIPGQSLFSGQASLLPWVVSLLWIVAGAFAWTENQHVITAFLERDEDIFVADETGSEHEHVSNEDALLLESSLRLEAARLTEPISEEWLERWVHCMLGPPQRLMLGTFGTKSALWSRKWYQFILHSFWVLPCLWLLNHPLRGALPPWLHFPLMIWLGLFLVLKHTPRLLELPKLQNPIFDSSQVTALGLALPVSLREVVKTNRLILLLRVLALAPSIVIVCCVAEWIFLQTCRYWWMYGLGVAACLPVLASAAVAFALTQFTKSTGRFSSFKGGVHILCILFNGLLLIGLFFWAFGAAQVAMWQKVLSAVLMLHLWVWLNWSIFIWLLHRRNTAWIRPVQQHDAQRGSS